MKSRDTSHVGVLEDIWPEVFKHLSTADLLLVSGLCTKFYIIIATHTAFWEVMFEKAGKDKKQILDDYIPQYSEDFAWKWRWLFYSWRTRRKLVVALYDYETTEEGEISLQEGTSSSTEFKRLTHFREHLHCH